MSSANSEESTNKVMQEDLDIDVMIWLSKNQSLGNLKDTLKSLAEGKLLPRRVIVLCKNSDIKTSHLLETLKDYEHNTSVDWRLVRVVANRGIKVSLDSAVKYVKSIYYTFFEAGYCPSPDLFSNMDSARKTQNSRFLMVLPQKGNRLNGLTINTYVNRLMGSNMNCSLIRKIRETAAAQDCLGMIVTHDRIALDLMENSVPCDLE